jgi:Ni/Fe-hydrogenase subunit HybB-like protein
MPKWTEFSITLMIIAMGFFLFAVAVKYLPIFPAEEESGEDEVAEVRPRLADVAPVLEHAGD